MSDIDFGCPAEDSCGVHFRVDQREMDHEGEMGLIISYVGNYAVVTYENRSYPLGAVIARQLGTPWPDQYETTVLEVGEGVVGDLAYCDVREALKLNRFVQTHDDWDNFEEAHNMVTELVRAGQLDLSRSFTEEA